MLRTLLAFIAALATTTVLAVVASTQFVLASLASLGADVTLGIRLSMTLHDIAGMAPLYGTILSVAFLIAWPVAALVTRYLLPGWRNIGYPLAGAVAVLVAILVVQAVLDINPIAGARSLAGFAVQGLAGAAGGYLFVVLAPSRAAG